MFGIKKFDLLIGLYMFCIVTSELMGSKTVPLADFGWIRFNATVALIALPLIYTINDVITEVYGKERTKSIIRAGLVIVALTLGYAALATYLPPSARFQPTEAAYDTIFQQSIRISFASLMAFAISEFTDVLIFVRMRKMMGKKALWLRNNVSNWISELLDTAVFMTIAFWSFDQAADANISFIFSIAFPYWLLRCAISVIETPFVYWGVSWLKTEKDA